MTRPKPIRTRRDPALTVARALAAMFCAATLAALALTPDARNAVLFVIFDWSK